MPVSIDERTWAMLAHLRTLVGYVFWIGAYLDPLVIYLVYKDKSSFVAFHALQSLVFQLAGLVVAAMLLVLALTIVLACVTIPALIVLGVGALAYGRIAVGDTEGCGGAGKGVSHDGANACF